MATRQPLARCPGSSHNRKSCESPRHSKEGRLGAREGGMLDGSPAPEEDPG